MAGMILSLLLPWLAAYLLVGRIVPGSARDGTTFGLRASLAIGLSLGLSAATYFLWLLLFGSPGVGYRIAELLGWTALIIVGLRIAPRVASTQVASHTEGIRSRGLVGALGAVVVIAGITTICESWVEPYGDWNAWAVWNVRAKFLFLGGEDWQRAFSPELRHPDYPLLVPATIARAWMYLKSDAAWVSWLIGNLFTWGTVALAACGVAKLKGRTQGLLAALVLAGNVAFVHCGSVQQYADVPLSFFMLATIVLISLSDTETTSRRGLLCLAGLCAGLATWTKNEGMLFVVALLVARTIVMLRARQACGIRRDLGTMLIGLLPMLTVVALQKTLLASENRMVHEQGLAATLGRVLDASRHLEVAQAFAVTLWKVGRGFVFILPIVAMLMGRTRLGIVRTKGFRTACLALLFMLVGYYCTYLVTPYDLAWHLRTSLNRLLVQVWPSAVFLFFVMVAAPEEILSNPDNPTRKRGMLYYLSSLTRRVEIPHSASKV